jgi:hypothetical protein
MALPFDDFTDIVNAGLGEMPGGASVLQWIETEASGPGHVNRAALVSGIAITNIINDEPNADDGVLIIDTGYALNPATDKTDNLFPGQKGDPAHSSCVALAVVRADDVDSRDAWLESVDAELRPMGNRRELFLTIKLAVIGDITVNRVSYQIALLYNSTRPAEMSPMPSSRPG